MTIAAGSIVLYQFKAKTTLRLNGASDIENAVASDLGAAGLTVVDFTAESPSLGAEVAAIWGYVVQITMKIKTKIDYGAIEDIQSICDHYVYVETDYLPSASAISLGSKPGAGDTTQVSVNPTGDSSITNWFDSFSTFLKGAGVGGFLGIGLALVAVVLIVSLVTAKKVVPGV